MPNFNEYKTDNLAWWGLSALGVTAWKLISPINVWNRLMDDLSGLFAAVGSFSQIATTTTVVTLGASPYTYTAGTRPEVLYISGQGVTSITRHGISLTGSGQCQVLLEPGGQVVIAYSGSTPRLVADTGGISNNVAGVIAAVTVGSSPFTYTAGARMEVIYLSGGSVDSVEINGISLTTSLPCTVVLPRGRSMVIRHGAPPLMVSDS